MRNSLGTPRIARRKMMRTVMMITVHFGRILGNVRVIRSSWNRCALRLVSLSRSDILRTAKPGMKLNAVTKNATTGLISGTVMPTSTSWMPCAPSPAQPSPDTQRTVKHGMKKAAAMKNAPIGPTSVSAPPTPSSCFQCAQSTAYQRRSDTPRTAKHGRMRTAMTPSVTTGLR